MGYFTIEKIPFEGAESTNPLAFKYYNSEKVVLGKKMKEHLKFSMAYWHTMQGTGADPFGAATMQRNWNNESNDAVELAKTKVKIAFEFMEKLGIEFFCFHDRDIAPQAKSLHETNRMLDKIVDVIEEEMNRTGIQLLWGTANLFNDPIYVHGAATSPNADVFACAAAQVKKAMEITKRLKGAGYVFWGGREGYETLLNTDMKRETDNFARFLQMVIGYAKEIDFTGQLYIEPKPKEPTKHQYDYDAAAVGAFLRKHCLEQHFKLNIETNHATLAMHTMQHELRYAADNGMFGSVDANQGDLLLGWDTDQFPTNIYETTMVMYEILRAGGFTTGGLNFDAKVRRGSFEEDDLFLAHIAGMDAFAKGLEIAAAMWEERVLENIVDSRYESWNEGIGKKITEGKSSFIELENYVLNKTELRKNLSGRQEMLEALINSYIFR